MDCGCGRSPNGKCLGWHDLSEEDYLEKLKEYRKKTGPAPKLFMPTDQDKEEAEKEASQLSQEQSRAEVS